MRIIILVVLTLSFSFEYSSANILSKFEKVTDGLQAKTSETSRAQLEHWFSLSSRCLSNNLQRYNSLPRELLPELEPMLVYFQVFIAKETLKDPSHKSDIASGMLLGDLHSDFEEKVLNPCLGSQSVRTPSEGFSAEEKAYFTKMFAEWALSHQNNLWTDETIEMNAFITDSVGEAFPSMEERHSRILKSESSSLHTVSTVTVPGNRFIWNKSHSDLEFQVHTFSDFGFLTWLNEMNDPGVRIEIGSKEQIMLRKGEILFLDIDPKSIATTQRAARDLGINASFRVEDFGATTLPKDSAQLVIGKCIPFFLDSALEVLRKGGVLINLANRSQKTREFEFAGSLRDFEQIEKLGLKAEIILTDSWAGIMVKKP